jgi:vacuolar-type H+-ATPase subunit E/Vma4
MSLADLTEKIEQDAQETKIAIMRDADQACAKITEVYAEKMLNLRSVFEKEIASTLERNVQKVTQGAEREAKNLVDRVKHNSIQEVYTKAFERLIALDDEAYAEILTSLVSHVPKTTSHMLIHTPKDRSNITKTTLHKIGIAGDIQETNAIRGGVILETETFEYNLSFEKLLGQIQHEQEVEIAEFLFGSN